jgi:hypothetical protein
MTREDPIMLGWREDLISDLCDMPAGAEYEIKVLEAPVRFGSTGAQPRPALPAHAQNAGHQVRRPRKRHLPALPAGQFHLQPTTTNDHQSALTSTISAT